MTTEEKPKKRKRKGVQADAPELPLEPVKLAEEPKSEAVKPVADAPVSHPVIHKLTVEVDGPELQLIQTYADLWNAEHAGLGGMEPVGLEQFLVISAVRWLEYVERKDAQAMEAGDEEDATPPEPVAGPTATVAVVDPVDDDPEFVEALAAHMGGRP